MNNRKQQLFSIAELISNRNISFYDHFENKLINLNLDSLMKTNKHCQFN